jgi:preprotein translocase subunit SecE
VGRPPARARPAQGPLRFLPGFAADIISELRKVTWPSRQDTVHLTIVVIVVALAVGAVLGAIDLGFAWLIDRLLLSRNLFG